MGKRAVIAFAASIAFLVAAKEPIASADVFGGDAGAGAYIGAGVGVIGGATTSIAAIVYALEDRAFDSPWVVTSLISSAACAALSGAFIVDGVQNGIDGAHAFLILSTLVLAAWPAYWTIKGAVLDVDPGEYFEEPETAASVAMRRKSMGHGAFYASATVLRF